MEDDSATYRIQQGDFKRPWRDLRLPHSRDQSEVEVTGVSAFVVEGNFDWGILVLETSDDVHGIGEVYRGEPGVGMAVEMCDLIEGEDPRDVNRLVSLIERNYMDTGAGQIGHAALTGIEVALLDIKGKLLGVPVYELLGGKYRNRIPIYCDTHAGASIGEADDMSSTTVYSPDAYASAVREIVDAGFDSLKVDLDVPTPGHDHSGAVARRLDNNEIDHKVGILQAVRDEIGTDIDLGVDLHFTFETESAIRLCERLNEFRLAWVEDPVPSKRLEAHRRVADAISTPLLTGENLVGTSEFFPFIDGGAMDIAAPDVTKCGGLYELITIANICDEYGVPLAPHNISSPVGTIAGVHAATAVENVIAIEYHAADVPWWSDLVTRNDSITGVISDGHIRVPEAPGLGIKFDWDCVEQHTVDGFERPV